MDLKIRVKTGLRGIASAIPPAGGIAPSVAPLTPDFDPCAVLLQGPNTPQPAIPFAPAWRPYRFLTRMYQGERHDGM